MRLVTFLPVEATADDQGLSRVAVVLASGRLLPLGILAQMMPDNLSTEIEPPPERHCADPPIRPNCTSPPPVRAATLRPIRSI